jgi:hypothetical protein
LRVSFAADSLTAGKARLLLFRGKDLRCKSLQSSSLVSFVNRSMLRQKRLFVAFALSSSKIPF